ncbi:MAG: PKD domain-containing protein, partial [Microthrixaceae bacterium]|nr:PKD domain-containing protein [Microthrixaceae bacterium]
MYVAEGVYTVVLTVTDDQGLTDTETVDITVTPGNQPPTVAPAADVTSGLAPLTVNFTSNAADSDGTIASVEWDFGDGNTSTDADPTHVYAAVGTYAATVTATDDLGA